MGLLAGVAAVSLRGLRSPAIPNAANEVGSAMKMARQMAIASGRRTYLVIPISNNNFTTNLFRTYAIFEEVPPGEQTTQAAPNGSYFTNNTTTPWFVARTDWRTLPEGVVFCNLTTSTYNTLNPDPFTPPLFQIGSLASRFAQLGVSGREWQYFESFANFDIRREDAAGNSLGALTNAPFVGFYPNGRAYYVNPGNRQGAGIRITQGFARSNQGAVTDTNNYYVVETDQFIGRVRVRNRESYR